MVALECAKFRNVWHTVSQLASKSFDSSRHVLDLLSLGVSYSEHLIASTPELRS